MIQFPWLRIILPLQGKLNLARAATALHMQTSSAVPLIMRLCCLQKCAPESLEIASIISPLKSASELCQHAYFLAI